MRQLSAEGGVSFAGLRGLVMVGSREGEVAGGAKALREGLDFVGQADLNAVADRGREQAMSPLAMRLVLLTMRDVQRQRLAWPMLGPEGCEEYPWWRVMLWLEAWQGLGE